MKMQEYEYMLANENKINKSGHWIVDSIICYTPSLSSYC